MRPEGGGHPGDKVGDPGPVLRHADARAVQHTRVPVRHVDGVLLVLDGEEPDPGGGEDVQGVHEGAADDAEHHLREGGGGEEEGRKEKKILLIVCNVDITVP